MDFEIQFLKVGESGVPGSEVYWMTRWNTWETLYFYLVVERGGGKTIVVNTAPPPDLTRRNHVWASGYGGKDSIAQIGGGIHGEHRRKHR